MINFCTRLVNILDDRLCLILKCLAVVFVPELADTITEINLYSSLINQDVVHPLISHDALILQLKLNEGKL